MQLSEINERLRSAWGLDIVIDAEGARSLKFVSDRGRFIEAVEAGPDIPDADHYVRRSLRAAGYTVAERVATRTVEGRACRADRTCPVVTGRLRGMQLERHPQSLPSRTMMMHPRNRGVGPQFTCMARRPP